MLCRVRRGRGACRAAAGCGGARRVVCAGGGGRCWAARRGVGVWMRGRSRVVLVPLLARVPIARNATMAMVAQMVLLLLRLLSFISLLFVFILLLPIARPEASHTGGVRGANVLLGAGSRGASGQRGDACDARMAGGAVRMCEGTRHLRSHERVLLCSLLACGTIRGRVGVARGRLASSAGACARHGSYTRGGSRPGRRPAAARSRRVLLVLCLRTGRGAVEAATVAGAARWFVSRRGGSGGA